MFKKLFKNSILYSLITMSPKLLGLVLLPIYTEYFKVSEYGVLGILEVSSLFIVSVFGFGLYWAFNRWYWDEEYQDSQKSMLFTLLVFLLITSVIIFLLLAFSADRLSSVLLGSVNYKRALLLMLSASFLEILGRIPLTLMKLQERPVLFSTTNIIKLLVVLTGTIIFITKMGLGLEGIYLAQTAGSFTYLILLLPYITSNSKIKLELHLLREMLAFSLPLIAASISGIILTITDRYSLKFLSDLTSVGLYALGFKFVNSIKVFIANSIQMALSPIIYKKMNDKDNGKFYAAILRYFSFVIFYFVIILSLFSQEIIKILAKDPAYWQAFVVVPIIGIAIVFGVLKDSAAVGIHITKNTKIMASIVTVIALINLILNVICIPLLGYIGAALATALAQALYFYTVYYQAQKVYFIPYNLRMLMYLIVTSIAVLGVLFVIENFELVFRLSIKALLIVLYPFVLYKIGYFEPEIVKSITGMYKKRG